MARQVVPVVALDRIDFVDRIEGLRAVDREHRFGLVHREHRIGPLTRFDRMLSRRRQRPVRAVRPIRSRVALQGSSAHALIQECLSADGAEWQRVGPSLVPSKVTCCHRRAAFGAVAARRCDRGSTVEVQPRTFLASLCRHGSMRSARPMSMSPESTTGSSSTARNCWRRRCTRSCASWQPMPDRGSVSARLKAPCPFVLQVRV